MSFIKRRTINSSYAPRALGPYNQAVLTGGTHTMYISGQLGMDHRTGHLLSGIIEQTEKALQNLEIVLQEANGSLNDVIKTTVLLQNMKDFDTVNKVYAQFFEGKAAPVRAAYQVEKLPKGALIEIEAVAVIKAATSGTIHQFK